MVNTSFGGDWTRDKLEILRRYLDAYTTALKNRPFRLIYVDAFAGEGYWRPDSEDYEDFTNLLEGSARIALGIDDKLFDQLWFIEKDSRRFQSLQQLRREHLDRDIQTRNWDANEVLVQFCGGMENFDRAVVFLDPFATSVSWATVEAIARTQKIDCWILFPVSAIARLMPTESQPSDAWAEHLDRVFGARGYWERFYHDPIQPSLFGEQPNQERSRGSQQIAGRYRLRLESVFHSVAPTRRVFRNSKNSPMFELFFGASNPAGAGRAIPIADHILQHW